MMLAAAWLIIFHGYSLTAIPMPSMKFCMQEAKQVNGIVTRTQCIAGDDTITQ